MSTEETQLKDIANRLKSIIDTAIDGIITINDQGLIETINVSAAKLFDYDPDEVIGHNIKMLMPQPYKKEHDSYLKRYQKTREPRIIGIGREVKGLKKNGVTFDFRLGVSEVILNDRTIFTGIVHDLTDVKKAEQKLKEVNSSLESQVEERTQELEDVVNELLKSNRQIEESQIELQAALAKEKELNELKSRFVSMASHEFRTPLSTILSSASIISKYPETHQQDNRLKHINRIKSSVANLTGILNDFLSLSKLEEGKVHINIQSINIKDLCNDVSSDVRSILKTNQNIIHRFNGPDHQVNTDPRILKNIMFNLISNAIKYSPQDSDITCSITTDHHIMTIDIIDHGIGIPLAEQQYLFERFFRATNVENIQGTGLGLNIVKRYIEVLKGNITFQSKPQVGTTFTVTLPIIEE